MEENLTIDYDIAFSTSYHVPVLYFRLRETPQVGPAVLEDIYNSLVPHQHQQSLRSNGVMGGISFGVCRPITMLSVISMNSLRTVSPPIWHSSLLHSPM